MSESLLRLLEFRRAIFIESLGGKERLPMRRRLIAHGTSCGASA